MGVGGACALCGVVVLSHSKPPRKGPLRTNVRLCGFLGLNKNGWYANYGMVVIVITSLDSVPIRKVKMKKVKGDPSASSFIL